MNLDFLSPMLLCDFYKISHRRMYPKKTEVVYSTWTPRASLGLTDDIVHFGVQAFLREVVSFFDRNFFSKDFAQIEHDYKRIIKYTLGIQDVETDHIRALHRLGYLPLSIRSLPEGSVVPLRTPVMTIENTNENFFWLTNYIETLASTLLWLPSTSATIANTFRKLFEKWAKKTGGSLDFVPFQGHDFSMRGMSSPQSGLLSGMGHLLAFVGTDTIPAIQAHEHYYNANVEKELVGTSIPASEHSIQCAYGDDLAYLNELITVAHPEGFVSIVCDGYDYWDVLSRVLPLLKDKIMARNGKVVIRPDSGDPVKIVCGDDDKYNNPLAEKGSIEALWDLFGGTVNAKGYKELDSHIGLIYGDAITYKRAQQIFKGLEAKGFASTNVVFGIGSFTYQYNTRDTFGYALKSTYCKIDGVEKMIHKTPKTDDGTKNSLKGRVVVTHDSDGEYRTTDGYTALLTDRYGDLLREVFCNGKITLEEDLATIRKRMRDHG